MEQQINLYQPILGAEKHVFSARAIAVALAVLVVSLIALAAFAGWRLARSERAVVAAERQQDAGVDLAGRASAALKPRASLAELDATAKLLAGKISARERALEIVNRDGAGPATGFAARLEALARRSLEGLWLTAIVIVDEDSRVALQGATTDPQLVPTFLAALSQERALEGVRFDTVVLTRTDALPPAVALFEVGTPGIETEVPPEPVPNLKPLFRPDATSNPKGHQS